MVHQRLVWQPQMAVTRFERSVSSMWCKRGDMQETLAHIKAGSMPAGGRARVGQDGQDGLGWQHGTSQRARDRPALQSLWPTLVRLVLEAASTHTATHTVNSSACAAWHFNPSHAAAPLPTLLSETCLHQSMCWYSMSSLNAGNQHSCPGPSLLTGTAAQALRQACPPQQLM
jgi:hypothetical protein